MTTLYLVRHAHAMWTADEGRPLSSQGYAAALRVAALLGALPITAVYASPSRRAYETVAPIADCKGLTVEPIDDLRERELSTDPIGEGRFLDAVRATWADPTLAWPGGESNHDAQRRGVAVIRHIVEIHRDQHIVIGTHGNLLALILQHFYPEIGFAFWQALSMPDVFRMEFGTEGNVSLHRMWQG